MNEIVKEKNIEAILEDLSYAFASPESQAFMECLGDKNYRKAKTMLLKKLNKEDTELVIKYFKSKAKNKFKLIEVSYEEFKNKHPYTDDRSFSNIQIVVNYRSEIISGYLSRSFSAEPEWYIHIGRNSVAIRDVNQIWVIDKTATFV
jgi:hypothetical protein